jgi:hypothetical protein
MASSQRLTTFPDDITMATVDMVQVFAESVCIRVNLRPVNEGH